MSLCSLRETDVPQLILGQKSAGLKRSTVRLPWWWGRPPRMSAPSWTASLDAFSGCALWLLGLQVPQSFDGFSIRASSRERNYCLHEVKRKVQSSHWSWMWWLDRSKAHVQSFRGCLKVSLRGGAREMRHRDEVVLYLAASMTSALGSCGIVVSPCT